MQPDPMGRGNFLRRIQFSPRIFDEASATAWWSANKSDVVRQHSLVPHGSGIMADLDSPHAAGYAV